MPAIKFIVGQAKPQFDLYMIPCRKFGSKEIDLQSIQGNGYAIQERDDLQPKAEKSTTNRKAAK